jgi:hypothetical protein
MNSKTILRAAASSVLIGAALSVTAAGNRHVTGGWDASFFGGDPISFNSNAIQHKNGSVKGHVVWGPGVSGTNDDALFPGGGKAYVCGEVTGGALYSGSPLFHMAKYVDNGEGKNAPADTTSPMFLSGSVLDCNDASMQALLTAFEAAGVLVNGNIQVKD